MAKFPSAEATALVYGLCVGKMIRVDGVVYRLLMRDRGVSTRQVKRLEPSGPGWWCETPLARCKWISEAELAEGKPI